MYTWGEGAGGRLGHGDEENIYEPKVVSALRGTHAVQVACGFAHTVVLSGKCHMLSPITFFVGVYGAVWCGVRGLLVCWCVEM